MGRIILGTTPLHTREKHTETLVAQVSALWDNSKPVQHPPKPGDNRLSRKEARTAMNEITEIILKLLWRFYPIAWLTTTIVRALARITTWLEDEESWFQLSCEPDDCAFVGGWLALAEERLNELIVMKAMKLLQRPYYPSQSCGHHIVRAVRTPQEIYRRLCRLVSLYHDHKRLYEKRAQKLQRLFAQAELQLEIIHHPVEPATTIFQIRSTTIFPFRSTTTILSASRAPGEPHPAQPIRAPPWFGSRFKTQPSRPARPPSREREIMPTPIAYRLLPTAYCRLPTAQLRHRSVRAWIGLANSRPSDRAAAHSFLSVRYHLAWTSMSSIHSMFFW